MTEESYFRDMTFLSDFVIPKTKAFLPPLLQDTLFGNFPELFAFVSSFSEMIRNSPDGVRFFSFAPFLDSLKDFQCYFLSNRLFFRRPLSCIWERI
jgi:hypothetical protein